MSPEPVTVTRVHNNNVVSGVEPDGREVVLLGKGVGYGRKPGDEVSASGGQRFVSDATYRAAQLAELLAGATWEEAGVAHQLADLAQARLNLPVTQAVLLPLLDHLVFAVKRAKAGIEIEFPLKWEVAQLYPDESAVGRRCVAMTNHALGIRLQPDEWVAFALHFVNLRWSRGELAGAPAWADIIGTTFAALERQWGSSIDRDSMGAARFVTHLRYLMVRAAENRQLDDASMDLMATIWRSQPETADTAIHLGATIGERLGLALTGDEVAYLALHVGRLHNDVRSRARRDP